MRHFAVVASFIIEFGASWGEFTIIDCRPNSGGGECTSAEYLLGFEVVVVEAGDVSDAPGHRGCDGSSSGQEFSCVVGSMDDRWGCARRIFWVVGADGQGEVGLLLVSGNPEVVLQDKVRH